MTLLAAPPAGAVASGSKEAPPPDLAPVRRRWVLAVPVGLALLLRLVAFVYPGQLFGVTLYDDGVYLGQVLHLLDGVMPYRHYTIVEPPGLMVLLAPVVAVGRLWGTDGAFALCRIVTALIDVANVALIGRLLRHRGRRAQLVGMTAMAIYPAALVSSASLLLEPYLSFFCLLAALAIFDQGRVAGRRRLLLGGVMLGVAGTVKIFAVFPLIALLLLWLFRHRDRLLPLLVGAAVGFGAVAAPFVALAPVSFFREVVFSQVIRNASGPLTPWSVLEAGDGSMLLSDHKPAAVIVGVCMAGVLLALLHFRRGRQGGRLDPLERYASVAVVVIGVAFVRSNSFSPHYAAFFGPFVAVLLGSLSASVKLSSRRLRRGVIAVVVASMSLVSLVELGPVDASRNITMAGALNRIPAHSCVLSDDPAYLIAADRFNQVPGCPGVVDTFGTTMVMSHGLVPYQLEHGHSPAPVVDRWEGILGRADYLVLSNGSAHYLPVTPAFRAWLRRTFVVVDMLPNRSGTVYRRR